MVSAKKWLEWRICFIAYVFAIVLFSGVLLFSCIKKNRSVSLRNLIDNPYICQIEIDSGLFDLAGWIKIDEASKVLRIYIEGDGYSFLTRNRLSNDPTPLEPVGLCLAISDQGPLIAYLSRPCQYGMKRNCKQAFWSNARFGKDVIDSVNIAVSKLKLRTNATHIELAGFSGGAAVAALVAARRKDVTRLITVAGNLDSDLFTLMHKVTPMSESINPADYACSLQGVQRIHFIGSDDNIIPVDLVKSFEKKACDKKSNIILVNNVTHTRGWANLWPFLLKTNNLLLNGE